MNKKITKRFFALVGVVVALMSLFTIFVSADDNSSTYDNNYVGLTIEFADLTSNVPYTDNIAIPMFNSDVGFSNYWCGPLGDGSYCSSYDINNGSGYGSFQIDGLVGHDYSMSVATGNFYIDITPTSNFYFGMFEGNVSALVSRLGYDDLVEITANGYLHVTDILAQIPSEWGVVEYLYVHSMVATASYTATNDNYVFNNEMWFTLWDSIYSPSILRGDDVTSAPLIGGSTVLEFFTATIDWFVDSFNSVAEMFYTGGSLTILGEVTVVGFAVSVLLLAVVFVLGLLRFQ